MFGLAAPEIIIYAFAAVVLLRLLLGGSPHVGAETIHASGTRARDHEKTGQE